MRFFIIWVAIIFLFFSCGKEHPEKKYAPPAQEVQEPQEQIEMKVFPLPSPYEISDVIRKAGVRFNADLLNSTQRVNRYVSDLAKALNIGVYGADLSYVNVFGDSELTLKYFEVVKQLSDELGLSALFPDTFLERIEDNIENPDSLYKIANQTFYKTYSYLYNRGKGDVASIILSGAFVEALYLAGQSVEYSDKPKLIYDKIAEQRFASQQLIQLLEQNSKLSSDVEQVLELMRQIDAIFRKITFIDDRPQYSSEDMRLLLGRVYKVRQYIVDMD